MTWAPEKNAVGAKQLMGQSFAARFCGVKLISYRIQMAGLRTASFRKGRGVVRKGEASFGKDGEGGGVVRRQIATRFFSCVILFRLKEKTRKAFCLVKIHLPRPYTVGADRSPTQHDDGKYKLLKQKWPRRDNDLEKSRSEAHLKRNCRFGVETLRPQTS